MRFCHSAAISATTAIGGMASAMTLVKTMIFAKTITAGFIRMPTSDTVEKVLATSGIVAKVEAMPTIKIPITEFAIFE